MATQLAWTRRPTVDDAPLRNERLRRIRGARAAAAGAITAFVTISAWGVTYPPITMIDADAGAVLATYQDMFRAMWLSAMLATFVPMLVASGAWTILVDWRHNGRLPKRRVGIGERLFAGALAGGAALFGATFIEALGWPLTELRLDLDANLASFATNPVNAARCLVVVVAVLSLIWVVAQLLLTIAAEEPVPERV